ncbi:MAG TPA: MaoC family dehydratase N-terminal domain-containing protein [Candidatus Acidoferrales bacterium]|jgi:3-methylfumaryl-CoA hydratase|nr:MaoC family dehydratase N-terminal domain-containing protein [Candidatus Acidoferrales bacterium]
MDIAHLRKWVGKTETASDQITSTPMAALSATLDIEAPRPLAGDPLPPLWHWLYFLETHRQSELGPDGHAKLGGFLPPVPLPRRMWAGGRFEFMRPLCVAETFTRTSRIVDVQEKKGRAGTLVFVLVRHEIGNSEGMALAEEQDLVYRDFAKSGDSASSRQPAPSGATWERAVQPDDVLLFRYSALTFNGHRIHYDRRFATETEGYPGLVVHGPLIATLLLELLRRQMPDASVSRFEFRAVSPLFDTSPFKLFGRPENDEKTISLWATDSGGGLAMTAKSTTR